eukprot:2130294-Amphidinium_carterae.1
MEADANKARTPPKKKPRRSQGEIRPLFDKGGHPRMSNQCLCCGTEGHMVKSCTCPTRRKDARSLQAEDAQEEPGGEDQNIEKDDVDEDDEPENNDDEQEEEEEVEFNPDNDDYVTTSWSMPRNMSKSLWMPMPWAKEVKEKGNEEQEK